MHSNLCSESSEDQLFDSDPGPQPATPCTRQALMHTIEYSLDVQNHRSPSIDSLLFISEAQGARQHTRSPMSLEGSGAGRAEERQSKAGGTEGNGMENGKRKQEYRKVVRSEKSREPEDEGEDKDEGEAAEEEEDEQKDDEKDDEYDTINVSPTPIRHKKVNESTRRRGANPIDPGRR
jgi:hypothetical protein